MECYALSRTPLFLGAQPKEVAAMLSCLGAERRRYAKGDRIYRTGDVVTALGIVLSGGVLIENNDFWGNTTVLDRVEPGQIFAETYACTPGEPLMVDVVAAGPSEILFLNVNRVLQVCPNACAFHARLVRNLLTEMARKNLLLSRKLRLITPHTIRERLLTYLSGEAVRRGTRSFVIPFDRQQLADYLAVERSALSAELSRMRRDGLIECERSRFTLLTGAEEV